MARDVLGLGADGYGELMAATGAEVIAPGVADVAVLPDGDLDVAAADVARICRTVRSVWVDYERKSLRAKMRAARSCRPRGVPLPIVKRSTRLRLYPPT